MAYIEQPFWYIFCYIQLIKINVEYHKWQVMTYHKASLRNQGTFLFQEMWSFPFELLSWIGCYIRWIPYVLILEWGSIASPYILDRLARIAVESYGERGQFLPAKAWKRLPLQIYDSHIQRKFPFLKTLAYFILFI